MVPAAPKPHEHTKKSETAYHHEPRRWFEDWTGGEVSLSAATVIRNVMGPFGIDRARLIDGC
jgi:hypothetical protein